MNARKFDRRIEVHAYADALNEFGDNQKTWAHDGKVWAQLHYGNGSERRERSAQEQSSLPVTVTVRKSTFWAGRTPENCRLVFEGQTWDIESIAPGYVRNRELIIIAKARTS